MVMVNDPVVLPGMLNWFVGPARADGPLDISAAPDGPLFRMPPNPEEPELLALYATLAVIVSPALIGTAAPLDVTISYIGFG